ncbi:chromate efflux transporter [Tahibacter amnicola]|uniref:Chromate efflux transporter n=1 Tax=Tahibacter amnicola TaxID=2976241 RepID=A0ABY6BKC9_9GAMM|nr:chromate efflux transporter [Tahibacter amnicola]UXI70473.1 chromate efflux transporter [Tahibacter amnicola]
MSSSVEHVRFVDAVRVWARIGWLSFGGPAGQIALMHRELVEQRRWISESRFLHALNYCMLLPGPEAQQLTVYIGWLMHGRRGGLVAGILFVLPGFLTMLVLSTLYALLGQIPLVNALFFGLKAAVLAIVLDAVLRIGRRALKSRLLVIVALAAFVAIFGFAVPFPLIVLGAAVVGIVGRYLVPSAFPCPSADAATGDTHYVIDAAIARGDRPLSRPSVRGALTTLLIALPIWLLPVAAVAVWLGGDAVITQQGILFSQTAVVTFGGAYAVLAYVAQRVVEDLHWLTPSQMLDGLGLAETTPGPLILVLQFVAFQAAFQHQAGLSPLVAGVLGSVLTVWVTFVPCFLWIFLGAPYVEALRHSRSINAALSAITAAVVGVVINLAVWFATRTVFQEVHRVEWGWLQLDVPRWESIDIAAAVLSVAAMVAMVRLRIGMGWTLLACAIAGAVWQTLVAAT